MQAWPGFTKFSLKALGLKLLALGADRENQVQAPKPEGPTQLDGSEQKSERSNMRGKM